MNADIRIERQGVCVAQWDDDSMAYLVMLPDGTIKNAKTKKGVQRIAKSWFKHQLGVRGGNVGIGHIEYR
jgi:hypothetical protein